MIKKTTMLAVALSAISSMALAQNQMAPAAKPAATAKPAAATPPTAAPSAAAPAGAAPAAAPRRQRPQDGGTQAPRRERHVQEDGRQLALRGHRQDARRQGDEGQDHLGREERPRRALVHGRLQARQGRRDAGLRGQRHHRLQHRRQEVRDHRLRQHGRLDQPDQRGRHGLRRRGRSPWARRAR